MARLAADKLGVPAIDLDEEISRETGRSIAQLFEDEGEQAFRERERIAMAKALAGPPMVISPGGGWAAQPGQLQAVEPRTLTLYLYVPVEVAADRLGTALDRPLLAGDPLPRLRELLEEREPFYRLASVEIDASAPPELVAAAVVAAAIRYGGWLP